MPRLLIALIAFAAVFSPLSENRAEASKRRFVSSQAYYHAMRAELALAKNELVQAADELQLALVYDSDSEYLTVALAKTSLKLGSIPRAAKLADRALLIAPASPAVWILRAHVELAKAQARLTRSAPERDKGPDPNVQAEKALKKAIELDPAGVEAPIELARLIAKRGRQKEAIALLYKAAERAPRSTEPFAEIAKLEVDRRRLRAASRALEYALERDPRAVGVVIALSQIYERQARYEEAAALWRKTIELVPDDVDALFYAARAELWVEHDAEAEKLVGEIQAMQRGPELELRLGLMYLEEGRAAPASVLLAEAVRSIPSDQRARFAYGVSLAQLGKDEAALAELELIGPEHELYVDARVRIGTILLSLGRSDRVKLALRHALDRQPNAAPLLSFSAIALERSGQLDEALRTLREARRQAPHELELAQSEATLLIRNGDRDRGTRLMRALVEQQSAPGEDALFRLGEVFERAGEVEPAVETMQRIIRESPDSARALNFLGYMFAARATRLDEAEKLLRRALALEPRSGAVLDSLGFVCFRRGKLEDAERYLSRAARLQPNDPEVLEHLGDVYLARGKAEQARESYARARTALDREVLAKAPEAPSDLSRVRKKLAELPGPARAEP